MEYYIYDVPIFVVDEPSEDVNLPAFCQEVEEYLPHRLLTNVEVVYIGNFKDLNGRNAAFTNGAIYMTSAEPTNEDMLENFIHEVAHSLEVKYGMNLYTDDLRNEFVSKRERLRYTLSAQGYEINPLLYTFTEYNEKFDNFLANEVGYPTLLTLTMGLFVSPYGATSLQEYFANGFEKYFLDNPRTVRDISPVLYRKIEEIINDDEA
tara:strand:+ start:659 stop:1279 length:621 start_codon:yes stop_codon:yes gene_type:complete